MSWDDLKTPTNDKPKDLVYKSTSSSHFYSIFRVGRKFKNSNVSIDLTMNAIRNFQKHMEREQETPNANINIQNEILIGNKNICENVQDYIKNIKLRTNAVIARELLLTASPDFFKGMQEKELNLWKEINMKWLEKNFGSNCIYATLHKDEKTYHIHALIVPKFKDKQGREILSNTRYFDGIERFRGWQDNYSQAMQERFKCLNRGIKYSKAKHIEIRHFYSLVNQNLNDKDISQVIAKAKNSELLEIKIKAIEKTLQVYKNYNSKNELQKEKALVEAMGLAKEIEKLNDNKEIYQEALSLLSQQYKIPQYAVNEAIRECKAIGKEREREL